MAHPVSLSLLLACLAGPSASETEQQGTAAETPYGPSSVVISGVDIVTVGIPYGFLCSANCYPSCHYSWTKANVTSPGPEFTLQLLQVEPTDTLTCTALNPTTGRSVTVAKTLQVTAGPSNIQISGPPMLTIGAASHFTCSASCYPSCSYSWTVVLNNEVISTSQGAKISVTPPSSTVLSETLICEAQDTVSHLFISTTLSLWVASLSDISISGDTTVTMGKQYAFICFVTCIPSCTFKWKYMGKTFQGDQVQVPILHQGDKPKFASDLKITMSEYSRIEPLTCEATNTISNVTVVATKNLTIIDPISVRPVVQALPLAGSPFSLLCAGSQNPASVTWLKDQRPLPESERVHLSSDNITVTFRPLLPADDGLYQCVVGEGGTPIQSVGYKLQVNYGPTSVEISGVDAVTVGILYRFQCIASCYPKCLFIWTRGNSTSQGPELSLKLTELEPTQNLICTASNVATGITVTARKNLQVTAVPTNIQISGPAFLTAGVTSKFTCSADCYPPCRYSWTAQRATGGTPSAAQGNAISLTPPARAVVSESLTCKAEDTVSHVFINKTLVLWVASLYDISITGDATVMMGQQYMFTCFVTCNPSCTFTWTYMGKTFHGDQIQIPILPKEDKIKFASHQKITISDPYKTEPLTCMATNTLSNATLAITKNLTVVDPFSVHPTSEAPPVDGDTFSLECSGTQNPASVTWLKDKGRIPTSGRVRVFPDNKTITFSPLLREDGGFYQCLVEEEGNRTLIYNALVIDVGTPILSVGYQLQVNYGPDQVLITEAGKRMVGEETFVLPGSTLELQCLSDCFPACSVSWYYRGTLISSNVSILLTPVTPPYQAALTCVARNSVTKKDGTAETKVVVPDGPKNVAISGPDSLEVGVTASFKCSAECSPSCSFTWSVYGRTMTGRIIDITVNRYVSMEAISCRAQNTFTGRTAVVNETLSVSEPRWCGC